MRFIIAVKRNYDSVEVRAKLNGKYDLVIYLFPWKPTFRSSLFFSRLNSKTVVTSFSRREDGKILKKKEGKSANASLSYARGADKNQNVVMENFVIILLKC